MHSAAYPAVVVAVRDEGASSHLGVECYMFGWHSIAHDPWTSPQLQLPGAQSALLPGNDVHHTKRYPGWHTWAAHKTACSAMNSRTGRALLVDMAFNLHPPAQQGCTRQEGGMGDIRECVKVGCSLTFVASFAKRECQGALFVLCTSPRCWNRLMNSSVQLISGHINREARLLW